MMKNRLLRTVILLGLLGIWAGCGQGGHRHGEAIPIPESAFEKTVQGKPVSLYTLRNERGMLVQITNYGARVVALWAPGADSVHRDVVWGYETIDDYLAAGDRFSGPIVGRYGNRIGGARFELDGREYRLTVNDGANHLHGGSGGFADKVWDARPFVNEAGEQAVEMSYLSPDGEEGYPGTLSISVTYTLTADNALRIDYRATTDAPTVLNPTSHVYFNLNGTSARGIGSHVLTIHAGRYTPTDGGLIPTGEMASVEGTPLDFRTATPIGWRVESDFPAMRSAGGYDHNWVLDRTGDSLGLAAEVYEPYTGILMKVWTDRPGLQFYSGNFMDGSDVGKRGDRHDFRTGIALETQNFPDAPNHDNFPSAVLRPGETYTQTSVYAFEMNKEGRSYVRNRRKTQDKTIGHE